MASKIKALGLAFVAITAMSAVAASAAQAGTLHLGSDPAVITGHSETNVDGVQFQTHNLSVPTSGVPIPVNCHTASFEGTVQQGQATQTIHEGTVTATYSSCKLAGQNAQVLMNGCKYTLTGAGQPATTSLVDIVGCTAGKQIEIKAAICTVDVPVQNGLSHVTAASVGQVANTQLRLSANVTNITATRTGAACPGGAGQTTAASFSGNTLVQAFKDKEVTQVTKHGHQYTEHDCGEMVHLIST